MNIALYFGLVVLVIGLAVDTQRHITRGIKTIMTQISDFAAAQAQAIARIQTDITAIAAKLSTINQATLSPEDQASLASSLAAVQGVANSLDALAAPTAVTPPAAPTEPTTPSP